MAGPDRPRRRPPAGLPMLRADERFVEALAAPVAEQVADRLHGTRDEEEGYLNAEAAGRYICVPRRRIHELTSAGLLMPRRLRRADAALPAADAG